MSPSWALQSQGLGRGPSYTAGGAEAWPLAAQGQALAPPCRGLGAAGFPPAPGQAGRWASSLQEARHSEPRLDSDAVLGQRGRAAAKGQLFMGRPGVLPRPALPSAFLVKWGEDRGKVPRVKLATFLIFPSKY